MVKHEPGLDATFAALADPTRRAILRRLARGEASVTVLARPFAVSLPAISKHLSVLERAGLLVRARDGRVRRCCLVAGPMKRAGDWIARYRGYWEGQLDALARYLGDPTHTEEDGWPTRRRAPRPRSTSRGPSRRRGRRSSAPGRTPRP
ncbi:MAG: helix-turn-helix transcriptional regulator [Candidatus Rokubacteria bacterium]|nr:helix-turn-helix transcriptional regulator [Candidatus Rokubacteria bacterium]